MYENVKCKNANDIISFEDSLDKLDNSWDGKVSFFPRYLQIEHTTRCNARCIMCNHLYTANRGAKDLDLNTLYGIEDVLKYAEIVMLNGDGEPFLYTDIDKSLALLQKYEVQIGTNTNLTVIPDNIWDYLNESFAFLNISCDGSTKELYESIRKDLSFDVFTENLKKLNKIAPDLNKNLDCVLMRQNIEDMERIVRFAAEYGFDSVRFHSLGVNPVIDNANDAPDLYAHYLSEQIEKARLVAESARIIFQAPVVNASVEGTAEDEFRRIKEEVPFSVERIKKAEAMNKDLSFQYRRIQVSDTDFSPAPFENGVACRWAIERCYLDLMGNITTCCYDIRHAYGNLQMQSFEEIWNGPLYRQLRKEMLKGRLPKWCKYCQWIKHPVF